MESLSDTDWEVVLTSTDLQQSLLALALSRSGKKVLHIDKNKYYGGKDAAFSLQEAEEWAQHIGSGVTDSLFQNVSFSKPSLEKLEDDVAPPKLSFSRAYSLSLSHQLIYTRSALLPMLVSSKVYRQLEFQAVGSWFVYSHTSSGNGPGSDGSPDTATNHQKAELRRVPNGREDVFADRSIDLRSKRALMNFLKFVADFESLSETWEAHASSPFPEFLSAQFRLTEVLQTPLLALTLSHDPPLKTSTAFALPRIARHLRSIGVFGPGFGAVIPKWGGGAEIAQVACRAGAVGGGVYVLGKGLERIEHLPSTQDNGRPTISLRLSEEDEVRTKWVVESELESSASRNTGSVQELVLAKSISIVSSTLSPLFPTTAEGAPSPAGAVVVYPTGSLPHQSELDPGDVPPVYIFVHSSDTGECPSGQCVLYASTSFHGATSYNLLESAVEALLQTISEVDIPKVLWRLQYSQRGIRPTASISSDSPSTVKQHDTNEFVLPLPSLDLALDDRILTSVKSVWDKLTEGDEDPGDFMVFEEREGWAGDDETE